MGDVRLPAFYASFKFLLQGFTSAGLSLAALFSNLTNSKLDFCTKLMEKIDDF